EDLPGEGEVLLDQGRGAVRGVRGDGVDGEPAAQHREVLPGQQLGGGGDELGLADRDHVEGRGGGAGALDVDVPGEGRGELSALGRVHRVVGLLPVPHPHDVQVTGGQAGLEVHHRGGEVLGAPGDQALAAGKTGETGEALQVPGVG